MSTLSEQMAAVLREMPAPADEPDPRVEALVTRARVLLARETHWSETEAMRCLAEVKECNEAAVQAIGCDLALAMAQGRIARDPARGMDLIVGGRP